VKAGGFDCFGAHRAQLLEVLPRALQAAGEIQQDRRHGQGSLFESIDGDPTAAAGPALDTLPTVPEWSSSDKLRFEKEALDFYISSHPLAQHEDVLRRFSTHHISDLTGLNAGQEVVVGGMLTQIRLMNTKKPRNGSNNTRYLRCTLENFTGSAECVMWPEDYARFKEMVQEDLVCFVAAAVDRTRDEPGLILNRIMTMDQCQRERTTGLMLALQMNEHGPEHIDALARVLKRTPGRCPVFLQITDGEGKRGWLRASQEFQINPATLAKGDLEMILGAGRVEFSRQGNGR
jgi:DNA polymerase-3 subunit alpha